PLQHFACLLSSPHEPPRPPLFPYTTLFRSAAAGRHGGSSHGVAARADRGRRAGGGHGPARPAADAPDRPRRSARRRPGGRRDRRSEEHTSELQSPYDLVCRLLLEKKKHTTP